MNQTLIAVSSIALSIFATQAQTPADLPEFEVASVKPAANPPFGGRAPMSGPIAEMFGFNGGPGTKDPGRITFTGVSLKMLLVRAYKMRGYQINGPGWLDTERYDITATLPPKTSDEQFRLMLQKLLTERFRIASHRDSKEMPQYRLTVAKGGPKLKPAEIIPVYENEADRTAAWQKQMAANRPAAQPAGFMGSSNSRRMARATVAEFAENLSSSLDLPVLDKTGCEGLYSFTLNWVSDDARSADGGSPGPSIGAALQEQLGLKLEAARGPVEILVIDKAEKLPMEN